MREIGCCGKRTKPEFSHKVWRKTRSFTFVCNLSVAYNVVCVVYCGEKHSTYKINGLELRVDWIIWLSADIWGG